MKFSPVLCFVFVVTLFCFSASAKTVNLSAYAVPDDGRDDAPGFRAAIDDLRSSGGGTLMVDHGVWNLSSEIDLRSYGNYVSYKIQGDKGAVIRLGLGKPKVIFTVGNVNQFEMRDLIFVGSTSRYDARNLLVSHYTQLVTVSGCQFFGILSEMGLFEIGNTDALFENNQFEGSGSNLALIYGNPTVRSITVRNNTFIDYGNFGPDFYSKPGGLAWIKVDGDAHAAVNANAGATVVIDGGRFDEGAQTAIYLQNVRNVQIRNIAVNVSGIDGGRGVWLHKVKYGVVTSSLFGFTPNVKPALVVENSSSVNVSRLDFGGGVYFADVDATSDVQIDQCPVCTADQRPAAKTRAVKPD